ncbi:MAG: flagella basal body P-ring formation protein FlgA, partial [Bradymonadia bacterium]
MSTKHSKSVGQALAPSLARALASAACLCAALLLPAHASATSDREAALETAIYDSLPWPDAEVEVEDLRVTGEWPSGELTWDVPPLRSIGSRARFRVFGERGGEAWVSAQVSVLVPVWIVDAPVTRGERVGPRASVALREARSLPTDARFADEPLRDEVARMSLAPGDLVRAAAVEQPLVIERQQLVR